MKTFIFILLLFTNTAFCQNNIISFKILNKTILDGGAIELEIRNNSKKDYSILIDTLFVADLEYDQNQFLNPTFFIVSETKKELFRHISYSDGNPPSKDCLRPDCNKKSCEYLSVIKIKSNSSKKFKLKFLSERKFPDIFQFFEKLDKTKSNTLIIKYKLAKEFLNSKLIKRRLNQIKDKNYKLFIGEIKSNEVPIEFKE